MLKSNALVFQWCLFKKYISQQMQRDFLSLHDHAMSSIYHMNWSSSLGFPPLIKTVV